MPAAMLSGSLSSPSIQALEEERQFLLGCVRAELAAVRRGEGSLLVADGLCRRLSEVESLLFSTLSGNAA